MQTWDFSIWCTVSEQDHFKVPLNYVMAVCYHAVMEQCAAVLCEYRRICTNAALFVC